MGFFNQWPYSNFHNLNLDWFIQTMKKVAAAADDLDATVAAAVERYLQSGGVEDTISNMVNEQVTAATDSIEKTLSLSTVYSGKTHGIKAEASLSNDRKTWLFIGDSWAAGSSPSITQESQKMTYKFAQKMGCDYEVIASSGAGFVVANDSGATIPSTWAAWKEANAAYTWENVGGVFVIGGVNDVRNNVVGLSQLNAWVAAIEGLLEDVYQHFNGAVPVYLCLDMKSKTTLEWARMYQYMTYRQTMTTANYMVVSMFPQWLYSNITANYEGESVAGSSNLAGLHPTPTGHTALANLLYNVALGNPLPTELYMNDISWLQNRSGVTVASKGQWYLKLNGVIRFTGAQVSGINGNNNQAVFVHSGSLIPAGTQGTWTNDADNTPCAYVGCTSTQVYICPFETLSNASLTCNFGEALFLGYAPA